jgi:hypothetical protein
MREYRVSYGNGQVNYPGDLAACKRELADMDQYREYAYVQRYEPGSADCPGEWVRLPSG